MLSFGFTPIHLHIFAIEIAMFLFGENILKERFVAIKDKSQLNAIMNDILQPEDFLQLLRIFKFGSIQHQFLILKIISLFAKSVYENWEQAA